MGQDFVFQREVKMSQWTIWVKGFAAPRVIPKHGNFLFMGG